MCAHVEPMRAQIDTVKPSFAGRPAQLAANRIAQLSYLHVGLLHPRRYGSREPAHHQDKFGLMIPNWDFATVRGRECSRCSQLRTQTLMSLGKPLRLAEIAVLAVSGHHNHRGGLDPVLQVFEGIRRTPSAQCRHADRQRLVAGGRRECMGMRPDLGTALCVIPSGATTLLMSMGRVSALGITGHSMIHSNLTQCRWPTSYVWPPCSRCTSPKERAESRLNADRFLFISRDGRKPVVGSRRSGRKL